MKRSFAVFLDKISLEQNNANIIALYRKVLYLYVLVFTLIQLPLANQIWGPESNLPLNFYEASLLLQSLNLLSHPGFESYYLFFAYSLIALCALSLFCKNQGILSILIYFFSVNLYHRSISIQNGGGDLLHLQLFLLIWMNENAGLMKEGKLKISVVSLSNIAFFAAQLQLIMVYVVSVGFKLTGTHWINGKALHYVLLNDDYTLHFIKERVHKIPVLLTISSWIVMLFQALFPFLVWIEKTKKPLLILGIFIHLMIVFVMGIVDFGILMLVMYLLFTSENWSSKILRKTRKSIEIKPS